MVDPVAHLVEAKRLSEWKRATSSLYYLATEYLKYDKLSETFHRPMLDEWDRVDEARLRGRPVDTVDLWPRDHIKTWCERARILRLYMRRPDATVVWWHAVEEQAQDSAVAIAKQLQYNLPLRRLFPKGVLPSTAAKRFIGASGFRLNSNRLGDSPSMRAWGAGSEATGGHSLVGVLDDPVGLNDVLDSQMPTRIKWYEGTVCNVVSSTLNGWKDVIGTRWDIRDPYAAWIASSDWVATVRACLETDGKPDYKGTPVYLPKALIEKKRRQMGESMFAFQMMNDPSPQSVKPWDSSKCEHLVTWEEAKGPGFTVVLSDPAPAKVGSFAEEREKKREDGKKDYWACAVVKFRRKGQRFERILLDLSQSQSWTVDSGLTEICRLQRKWGTPYFAIERFGEGVAYYQSEHRRIARREAVRHAPLDLTLSRRSKNEKFGALADAASMDEFLICETVPRDIMEVFLEQARLWRPLPNGKNSLEYDDLANCVSFSVDPVFLSYVPRETPEAEEWSPYRKNREEIATGGSRWVSWS